MTEPEKETQRLTFGDLDAFDRTLVVIWAALVYAWPLWAMRGPAMLPLSYLFAAFGLTIIWGLPLALLGGKLRAPLRRLCGLTAATAGEGYHAD